MRKPPMKKQSKPPTSPNSQTRPPVARPTHSHRVPAACTRGVFIAADQTFPASQDDRLGWFTKVNSWLNVIKPVDRSGFGRYLEVPNGKTAIKTTIVRPDVDQITMTFSFYEIDECKFDFVRV